MKTPQLKQFFKATALALCISSAAPAFAQTVDQVVAVVDNSVILQSDLAQTAAATITGTEQNRATGSISTTTGLRTTDRASGTAGTGQTL